MDWSVHSEKFFHDLQSYVIHSRRVVPNRAEEISSPPELTDPLTVGQAFMSTQCSRCHLSCSPPTCQDYNEKMSQLMQHLPPPRSLLCLKNLSEFIVSYCCTDLVNVIHHHSLMGLLSILMDFWVNDAMVVASLYHCQHLSRNICPDSLLIYLGSFNSFTLLCMPIVKDYSSCHLPNVWWLKYFTTVANTLKAAMMKMTNECVKGKASLFI